MLYRKINCKGDNTNQDERGKEKKEDESGLLCLSEPRGSLPGAPDRFFSGKIMHWVDDSLWDRLGGLWKLLVGTWMALTARSELESSRNNFPKAVQINIKIPRRSNLWIFICFSSRESNTGASQKCHPFESIAAFVERLHLGLLITLLRCSETQVCWVYFPFSNLFWFLILLRFFLVLVSSGDLCWVLVTEVLCASFLQEFAINPEPVSKLSCKFKVILFAGGKTEMKKRI